MRQAAVERIRSQCTLNVPIYAIFHMCYVLYINHYHKHLSEHSSRFASFVVFVGAFRLRSTLLNEVKKEKKQMTDKTSAKQMLFFCSQEQKFT